MSSYKTAWWTAGLARAGLLGALADDPKPPPAEFITLKHKYEQTQTANDDDLASRIVSLRKDYIVALTDLQQDMVDNGRLDAVLAIKTEMERLEYKQELSDEQKESMFPELRTLREKFEQNNQRVASDHEQQAATATKQYVGQLQALEKQFQQRADTNGVAAVRAEKETVQGTHSDPSRDYTSGRFTLRAYIDGSDDVYVQDNRIWYVHEAGALPGKAQGRGEPTYINNDRWVPSWNAYESRPYDKLQPPLHLQTNKRVYLTKKFGRGDVLLLEQPTPANNFRLKILIDDRAQTGADWYEIQVRW